MMGRSSAAAKKRRRYSSTGLMFASDFTGLTDHTSIINSGYLTNGNTTTQAVSFQGRQCVKIDLDHFTDVVKHRTELQPINMSTTYFDSGRYAKIGQVYWYGLLMYLPTPAYNSDTTAEAITQWHDIADAGESDRNTAIAMLVRPDPSTSVPRIVVVIRSDSKPITPATGGEARYDHTSIYDLGAVSDFTNRWLHWVWRIKWGYNLTDGETKLWLNGQVVLDKPAEGNCFNDAIGPYFKFGVYKWPWQDAPDTSTGIDHRTLYFDDVRIGNSLASYSTVGL